MTFKQDMPWVREPLVAVAPMRLISLAQLSSAVTMAGGLGFIGAGNDTSNLAELFEDAKQRVANITDRPHNLLPIGVGFLNWGADINHATELVAKYRPCAVWFFAARTNEEMERWTKAMRQACPETKIWIQVSTVKAAVELTEMCRPDVLVIQGTDAGGHGLTHAGASLVTILPEAVDALAGLDMQGYSPKIIAAGGIIDGRGAAAALTLGAQGVVLGTAYLAAEEAVLAPGYRKAVLESSDGGVSTIRSSVYDELRGTTDWPAGYGGRGIINQSYIDAQAGMRFEDNKKAYDAALKDGDKGFGLQGRLTTYAGTGIGLIREIETARAITEKVRDGALEALNRVSRTYSS